MTSVACVGLHPAFPHQLPPPPTHDHEIRLTRQFAQLILLRRIEELERQSVPPRNDSRTRSPILVPTPIRILSSILLALTPDRRPLPPLGRSKQRYRSERSTHETLLRRLPRGRRSVLVLVLLLLLLQVPLPLELLVLVEGVVLLDERLVLMELSEGFLRVGLPWRSGGEGRDREELVGATLLLLLLGLAVELLRRRTRLTLLLGVRLCWTPGELLLPCERKLLLLVWASERLGLGLGEGWGGELGLAWGVRREVAGSSGARSDLLRLRLGELLLLLEVGGEVLLEGESWLLLKMGRELAEVERTLLRLKLLELECLLGRSLLAEANGLTLLLLVLSERLLLLSERLLLLKRGLRRLAWVRTDEDPNRRHVVLACLGPGGVRVEWGEGARGSTGADHGGEAEELGVFEAAGGKGGRGRGSRRSRGVERGAREGAWGERGSGGKGGDGRVGWGAGEGGAGRGGEGVVRGGRKGEGRLLGGDGLPTTHEAASRTRRRGAGPNNDRLLPPLALALALLRLDGAVPDRAPSLDRRSARRRSRVDVDVR